ncbi:PD-(D/E)XK nuclease family protein [Salinicoccus kekensis]|nr:PD-(D/E)XK nuclease family protein [Salinicoccus kekensis]
MIGKEERDALQNFLMNTDELDKLEGRLSGFNVFETLGIVNMEIRHSNVIGWLFSPNEQHGWGDAFLKRFLQEITQKYEGQLTIDPLDLLLWDYHDLIVRREWQNIDLLAVSESNKFVLVIENKVWSKESRHQLNKYHEIIKNGFPDYHKVFVYLTPFGDEASNPDLWLSMDYNQMVNMINSSLERRRHSMETSVKLFIEQYMDILRRYVVGDKELEKICQDIYFKHKKALDLIFEYKPDMYSEISTKLQGMIESHEDLVLDSSNKNLIRFTTNQLAETVEAEGRGWTSSRRILLFEFQNTARGLRIKLIIGPGESAVREKLYDIASNNTAFRGRNGKLTTAYTTIFVKNILDYNEAHEVDPEKLHNDIESRVERFFGKDLKTLEKVILEGYGLESSKPPMD